MKIRLKLPLAFALSLGLLFASSMYGLFKLNHAVDVYARDVFNATESHRIASLSGTDFASAVQEWKNVLLRGKDEKKREDYWNAHEAKIKGSQAGLANAAIAGHPGSRKGHGGRTCQRT